MVQGSSTLCGCRDEDKDGAAWQRYGITIIDAAAIPLIMLIARIRCISYDRGPMCISNSSLLWCFLK